MVSVIMCAYNESVRELSLATKSILRQTYEEIEFIIVLDNPQNKVLLQEIRRFEESDKRVKVIINSHNMGLANSLNVGINYASGEYIARMDADDIASKYRLKKQVEYLDGHAECDVVGTDRYDIDENNKIIYTKHIVINDTNDFLRAMQQYNTIIHPSVMFRRSAYNVVKGYRDFKASQDYDLWLRMLKQGLKFHIIEEPLLLYRVREQGITRKNFAFQHANHEYIKHLNKKENKGQNYFSEEERDNYYKKLRLKESAQQELFNEAHLIYKAGVKEIRKEKYIVGANKIIKAIRKHKEILNMILSGIKFEHITRKYVRETRELALNMNEYWDSI